MRNQVTWVQALLGEIRLGVDGEEVGRGSDLRRGRGFGEDRKRSKERGSIDVLYFDIDAVFWGPGTAWRLCRSVCAAADKVAVTVHILRVVMRKTL